MKGIRAIGGTEAHVGVAVPRDLAEICDDCPQPHLLKAD
jgi:hypothetical protein